MKIKIIATILLLLPLAVCYSQEDGNNKQFPTLKGYVNDFENIYSAEEIKELTEIIVAFKKETGNEIVIATINNIGNYSDFNKYTKDLSNYWSTGKLKNLKLTIIFSKKLRLIKINTHSSITDTLSDDFCKKIIDEIMIPEFKRNNYFSGVRLSLFSLTEAWK